MEDLRGQMPRQTEAQGGEASFLTQPSLLLASWRKGDPFKKWQRVWLNPVHILVFVEGRICEE